jgi:hypothetical protein
LLRHSTDCVEANVGPEADAARREARATSHLAVR